MILAHSCALFFKEPCIFMFLLPIIIEYFFWWQNLASLPSLVELPRKKDTHHQCYLKNRLSLPFLFFTFRMYFKFSAIRSAAGYTCSSWDCVGLNSFSTSPALSRTSPILSSTHNSRVSKNLLLVLLLVLVLKTKRLRKWASRRNSVGSPFPEHLLAPGIINFQAAYNYAHIG